MESRHWERRDETRHPVQWRAEACIDGKTVVGELRDVNQYGSFFVPEPGTGRQRPLVGLDVDDAMVIAYAPNESTTRVVTVAVVRWRGHSRTNGCEGIGIEFDHTPGIRRETAVG